MKVLLRPDAEADIKEAFDWYEAQRPGLGGVFLHAVDVAVASAGDHPRAYAVLHRDVRRVLLRKFPYGLFFRLLEDDTVVVLGCIHAKRHPRVWKGRGRAG